ncbi:hypothetical protein ACS0TY_010237 [Phlomoides rotata]
MRREGEGKASMLKARSEEEHNSKDDAMMSECKVKVTGSRATMRGGEEGKGFTMHAIGRSCGVSIFPMTKAMIITDSQPIVYICKSVAFVSGEVIEYDDSATIEDCGITVESTIRLVRFPVAELPVEHGLLLDNLLDLAHAPFTHTSTFVKGWSVPSMVNFLTHETGLQGYWDPYPIDMEFLPPCMVLSTIGISKPGKLEGQSTQECSTRFERGSKACSRATGAHAEWSKCYVSKLHSCIKQQ